jgi:protein MpaA
MKILKKKYSKNNNEIVLTEWAKTLPQGKTILIIGVVHGDEPQGKFLIENYLKYQLSKTADKKSELRELCKNRLLFIPCLNPDGLFLNTRQNSNGVDLNRNFPTSDWELTENSEYFGGENSSSEIETKFVMEILEEFSPDLILTLHAPYKVVNYDGPAKEIAEEISKIIGYPIQKDIGYKTPGSFGTYAGIEKNIPTITLELDEEINVKELIQPINEIFYYLGNTF